MKFLHFIIVMTALNLIACSSNNRKEIGKGDITSLEYFWDGTSYLSIVDSDSEVSPIKFEISKIGSVASEKLQLKDGKQYESKLNTYQFKFKPELKNLEPVECVFLASFRKQNLEPRNANPAFLKDSDRIQICKDGDDVKSFAKKIESAQFEISYYVVPQLRAFCAGELTVDSVCQEMGHAVNLNAEQIYNNEKYHAFILYKNGSKGLLLEKDLSVGI